MKISHLAAAFGLTVSLASAAVADSTLFSFGQTNVTVQAEDDFCALNATHKFDKAWLEIQVRSNLNQNEVVGAYMPCDELARLRGGEAITNSRWIILLSPVQNQGKAAPLNGVTRAQLIDLLAKEFAKGVPVDIDGVNQSVNQATSDVTGATDLPPIEITSGGSPSLLATTDTGVYAGLKLDVQTASGVSPVGAVLGITLVNQHMLSVNVYQQFEDPKTINTLLDQATVMIDKVVALNN